MHLHQQDDTSSLDFRDVEQITLSWDLIQEGHPDYKDAMAKVLDKRIAKIMPRIMKNKCQDVSAHSRAVIIQLDMLVHCLHGPMHQQELTELFEKAGELHANLGVHQKHYFLLGEAMLSTLEFFLASSSGYWKRVQRSWNILFQTMFDVMKTASKKEGKRQDMMLKANRRSERHLKLSPPTKNHSLNTVDTMMSQDSLDESHRSSDSFRNLGSQEIMDLRMDKKSSRSMRNLMGNSQQQQQQHEEYDMPLRGGGESSRTLSASSHEPRRKQATKTRPASMRNLFAGGGCPRTPEQLPRMRKTPLERSGSAESSSRSVQSMRNVFALSSGGHCPTTPEQLPSMRNQQQQPLNRSSSAGTTRPVSMRNLFSSSSATDSPTIVEEEQDVEAPRRGGLLRTLSGGRKSKQQPSSLELPPPPPPHAPSPRSVASPGNRRPGLNRSSSSRRDCAVFTMDSPMTARSKPQTPRKMSKGGVKQIMMQAAAAVHDA